MSSSPIKPARREKIELNLTYEESLNILRALIETGRYSHNQSLDRLKIGDHTWGITYELDAECTAKQVKNLHNQIREKFK